MINLSLNEYSFRMGSVKKVFIIYSKILNLLYISSLGIFWRGWLLQAVSVLDYYIQIQKCNKINYLKKIKLQNLQKNKLTITD